MWQWLLSPCDTETAEGSVSHSLVKCHQKSEKYTEKYSISCKEKLSKVLDTLCDDYDDVKLLYKGKTMVGEK